MRSQAEPTRTLFDVDYQGHSERLRKLKAPYTVLIDALDNSEDPRFPENELSIFGHVLEHERCLYEPRGYIAGPLDISVRYNNTWSDIKLAEQAGPWRLSPWVEDDCVRLRACQGDGVLMIEDLPVFEALRAVNVCDELNLLLVTGVGLPRLEARRMLHRISSTYQIPVYVVTDNDTWGYFHYSLLRRGMLAPHEYCEYLAVHDARYMGLRAGEFFDRNSCTRAWNRHWAVRMKHLRTYPCFGGDDWEEELSRFEEQHCAVSLQKVLEFIGPREFVTNYLKPKLSEGCCLR